MITMDLDAPIGQGGLVVRSQLQRGMSRPTMMLVVINRAVDGGWLECLRNTKMDKGKEFDAKQEMARQRPSAAQEALDECQQQEGSAAVAEEEEGDGDKAGGERQVGGAGEGQRQQKLPQQKEQQGQVQQHQHSGQGSGAGGGPGERSGAAPAAATSPSTVSSTVFDVVSDCAPSTGARFNPFGSRG